ncbi:MAG: PilZ domain-containing protein [Nitrospirae bacterium]|nr:PilZ domain-containing protein [Nitrospirota bacterium]
MKSRRKFRRLTIMGLGKIALQGEKKFQETYIANVSRGGAGIYLNKPLKVGTEVIFSYPSTDPGTGNPEHPMKSGVVVWCKRCGGVYAMGIKFDRVDEMTNR